MPAPLPDAWIDAVDASDRPVGRIRRADATAADVGFRVIHILVLGVDGALLLQQVGRTRDRSPLRWGSSVAGYVAAGESYAEAAYRRQHEELGIEDELEKVGSTTMQDGRATKFISLYLSRATTPRLVDPVHVERLEWWTPGAVDDALRERPDVFTETFPVVHRLYRAVVAV